jgi:transcriptional regulator with XRE-family HTH domain
MFKDKLKENRLKLGMSQEALAQKVFVSRSAVAKWEQGRGLPEDESLERLAKLFGVSSDDLLTKEDMKQEIAMNEEDLTKNKKKTLISSLVAGIAVVAMAVAVLCGAFIYRPSGEEAIENDSLAFTEMSDSRLLALNMTSKGRINYSQWQDCQFVDEFGSQMSEINDLNLREGDELQFSYLADKNAFGKKKIGSLGISNIALKSHRFSKNNTLFGVGCSFADSEIFSDTDALSSYVRWYEMNPDSLTGIAIDLKTQNVYSLKITITSGAIDTIDYAVAFDPAKIPSGILRTFFNGYSNNWDSSYFDMKVGRELSFQKVSTVVIDSLTSSLLGAMPQPSNACGYSYVRYNLTVLAKQNPSRYQIKSYDSLDALLGTTLVSPSSDLSTLSLPKGRAYSFVEEYQGDSLVSTSEKMAAGAEYHFYFSNAAGFYDRDKSRTTL